MMRETTDPYIVLQEKNKTTTEELSKRIRERLRAFEASHEEYLRDSEPCEDRNASLTVDSTLCKISDLERNKARKMQQNLKKVSTADSSVK